MTPFVVAKLNIFFACAVPSTNFFFFDPWWKYLNGTMELGKCVPTIDVVNHPNQLWLIGLAVLDDLLKLAGFLAVISIMVAGAQLVFTEGNPEKATSARNRLINSLVGLGIAFSAVALVTLAGNTLGGASTNYGIPNANATTNTIQKVLEVGFAILGAFAFLFMVLAGLRFITSGDNPTKVAEARRQIIYAALGMVLIALAATIVNFVINKLKNAG